MAKLICKLDSKVVNEHALDKARITLGRRQDNDIVIDHLAVSGLHADIETIGDDSFLTDLNSTNGTVVNLKPIKKHILKVGDVIEIGRYQFVYDKSAVDEAFAKASSSKQEDKKSKFSDTQQLQAQKPSLQSVIQKNLEGKESTARQAEKPAAAATANASLRILSGDDSGQNIALNKTLTTVGQSGGEMIAITKRRSGFFVSQIEGHKTLTINQKTPANVSEKLNNKDIIEIDGVKMQFVSE